MKKTPPLSIVKPGATGTASKRTSPQTGAELFKSIDDDIELEADGIELLKVTAAAQDRLCDISKVIECEGILIAGRRGHRVHPLLKIESGLRALISRNLIRLGASLEEDRPVGRQPHPHGISWRDLRRDEDDDAG